MTSITVTLPYPPSANRYWRHRALPRGGISTYISSDGKAFRANVHHALLAAGVRKPIQGRVHVEYTLYPARPKDWQTRVRKLGDAWHDTVRCIDLDNAQKALMDALKGVAFEDDGWVHEISAKRSEPDGDARLVVRISPVDTQNSQSDLF